MKVEPQALREIAVRAVEAGMAVVRDRSDDDARVDHASEEAIVHVLTTGDRDTPVVGDVVGVRGHPGRVWVVDPVDGSTNLEHGDPFVGVTVALLVNGEPAVGATGCPFTDELWSAARGLGAQDRHGRQLELVDSRPSDRRIVLDPAVSNRERQELWESAHTRISEVFERVELRSAIALELAHTAAGVFDGFVQIGGSPVQDFAAGVLLVREAGGIATGLDGRLDVWRSDIVIAGTPATHRQLKNLLLDMEP